jgi:hypothetical protein
MVETFEEENFEKKTIVQGLTIPVSAQRDVIIILTPTLLTNESHS